MANIASISIGLVFSLFFLFVFFLVYGPAQAPLVALIRYGKIYPKLVDGGGHVAQAIVNTWYGPTLRWYGEFGSKRDALVASQTQAFMLDHFGCVWHEFGIEWAAEDALSFYSRMDVGFRESFYKPRSEWFCQVPQ